jgi:hypothetical protein
VCSHVTTRKALEKLEKVPNARGGDSSAIGVPAQEAFAAAGCPFVAAPPCLALRTNH